MLGAVALIALAAGSAANAATTISLGGSNVNWGNTHTYSTGFGNIVASGFTAANTATALYGKNLGGDEIGLGLNNDPSGDHEIYYGYGYVQLDVSALFGLVSGISFTTNSTTEGEQWSIYGSNTAGSYTLANLLLSGTNESGGALPSFGTYKYYDFVSTSTSGGKNFLISTLSLSAVPEPSTWAMMLFGFGGIGLAMRRRKRAIPQLA
jgi:hypothetical protein